MNDPIKIDIGIPLPEKAAPLLPESMAARECPIGGSFLGRKSKRASVDYQAIRRGLKMVCQSVDKETLRFWIVERPNGKSK